ncbi:MAG: LptF/LptG family permease [Sphingobium sp.]
MLQITQSGKGKAVKTHASARNPRRATHRSILTLLDRYILRQLASRFATICAVIIVIMLIEHIHRLLNIVHYAGRKLPIVVQSITALLPEYLAIAMFVGLYLAVAVTVRRLTLRGELDVIEATGRSGPRMLSIVMMFAAIVGLCSALNEGWGRPWGERYLQQIGHAMDAGTYGLSLAAREPQNIAPGVFLYIETVDPASGMARQIVLRAPGQRIFADQARIFRSRSGQVVLSMRQGLNLTYQADGSVKSIKFDKLDLTLEGGLAHSLKSDASIEQREILKAQTASQLISAGDGQSLAVLGKRFLWSAFTVLGAPLGLLLGRPARRSAASFGLILGIIILTLELKLADLVESSGTDHPIMTALFLLSGITAMTFMVATCDRRLGHGFIDSILKNWVSRMSYHRKS